MLTLLRLFKDVSDFKPPNTCSLKHKVIFINAKHDAPTKRQNDAACSEETGECAPTPASRCECVLSHHCCQMCLQT
uniref:Uncharacterized protein n=1 Tax=Kryptolebias marmoratus TaxID=37003 RepID=A0A3Q3FT25_KRYMA